MFINYMSERRNDLEIMDSESWVEREEKKE